MKIIRKQSQPDGLKRSKHSLGHSPCKSSTNKLTNFSSPQETLNYIKACQCDRANVHGTRKQYPETDVIKQSSNQTHKNMKLKEILRI